MNTVERLNKKISDLGITDKTPYHFASDLLSSDITKRMVKSEKVANLFAELNAGMFYTCPHCQSETLLEFGACHWCDEEIAMPSTAVIQKSSNKKEALITKEKIVEKEIESKPESKKVKSVKTSDVLIANSNKSKYAGDLKSLEYCLEQASNKENKHAELVDLVKGFELKVKKPELEKSSSLRALIIAEVIEMITFLKEAKPKKGPKIVEIDESEIDFDSEEELELDEENDDSVIATNSNDEDDADSAEVAPKKSKKEKVEKKTDSKKKSKKEVIDDEIDFEDDEEEKPATKKSIKPDKHEGIEFEDEDADEEEKQQSKKPNEKKLTKKTNIEDDEFEIDDEIELDEDDLKVDTIEIEEEEFDLSDDEDIED